MTPSKLNQPLRERVLEERTLTSDQIKSRALDALRDKRLNLAEALLQTDDVSVGELVENLRIYQAELEIQNDELMRSYRDAQDALGRFTALFQVLPVAGLVVDRHGMVMQTNNAAQTLFNLDASHLRQHFLLRMIAPDDRTSVMHAWGDLSANASVVVEGIAFHNGTDTGFRGDLHLAPLPSASDGQPQFVCVVLDRSDILNQHQRLEETTARLRHSEAALTERVKELSAVRDILIETSRGSDALDTVLRRVVDRLRAAWQFPELAEARILLPDATFQTQGFRETPWSQVETFPIGEGQRGEIRVVYLKLPVEGDQSVFLDDEQALLHSISSHLGVYIARCRHETKLRESIESYRVLADYNPEWEYWLDPNGRYRYVSPACLAISGYAAEDFLSDTDLFARLIHPDDRHDWDVHQASTAVLSKAGAQLPDTMQLRILDRAGKVHWLEHVCCQVHAEDGRFLGHRGTNREITKRKEFQDALERSQELLNATGRLAKVGGWEYDPARQRLTLTAAASEILGVDSSGVGALSDLIPLLDARDQPKLRDATERALADRRPFDLLLRLAEHPEQQIWVQIRGQPIECGEQARRLMGAVQDVTARVEAEKSLRQAARVFESTAEGVVITDPDGRILAVNKAFTDITGYSEEEVRGENPRILKSGRHPDTFYEALWRDLKQTGSWRGELWNAHKGGHIYPELMTISAVFDSNDEITHYVGVFRDITHIKRSEEQLIFLAHHDALTGLPNRSLFQLRLEHCLQRASRHQHKAAVFFIDLDRFKVINDTLGHLCGDSLLKKVAEALAAEVRVEDTIARLGGDEFVILLEKIVRGEEASHFAERILNVFSRPFRIQDRDLFVTASIGISLYPDNGEDCESLLRQADVAMYRTKGEGHNGFTLFEPSMIEGGADRFRLENDLRRAVEGEQLRVHYQAQVAIADGRYRLTGVEALCRWDHPALGTIAPGRFIPLAEDVGMIDPIGAWVLEESCRQLAAWDRDGLRVPRLAVNLSMHQLARAGFSDRVHEILLSADLPPERLELELTETAIMRDPERSVETLGKLRSLGISVAVDDFGTGYSSLAYLKRLPLNRLKIDRAFVQHLPNDDNDASIVRAIIALSQSLALDVIAEGVETEPQADCLRQLGCRELQGFLISRPVAADDFASAWT